MPVLEVEFAIYPSQFREMCMAIVDTEDRRETAFGETPWLALWRAVRRFAA